MLVARRNWEGFEVSERASDSSLQCFSIRYAPLADLAGLQRFQQTGAANRRGDEIIPIQSNILDDSNSGQKRGKCRLF